MESAKPSVYTSGNSEGIDRVRKEDGMYAFFMEAAVIEYHIERKCDLTMIGGLLDSKGYGIALPPGKYLLKNSNNKIGRKNLLIAFFKVLHTQVQYQLESCHSKKKVSCKC